MTAAPAPELLPVCPECGYDLRGLTSDRCPECGLPIDREVVSRIPWVHRQKIGRVKAYWRTVWLATFRTEKLAEEVRRPVSIRDGQTFRWVTMLLAWVPLAAILGWAATNVPSDVGFGGQTAGRVSGIVFTALAQSQGVPLGLLVPYAVGLATPGVLPAAALLSLVLWTGAAGYFFHPRRLPTGWQNRAIAISYFACAPLVLTALPVAAAAVLILYDTGVLGEQGDPPPQAVVSEFGTVLFVVPLLILLGMLLATLRLLRKTTLIGGGRRAAAGVAILVLWVASIAGPILAVPWVVGFVRLMVSSLRAG